MFDAGAEQSLGLQYDYSQTSATTATTNAHYSYATQVGYTNYTQTAQPSYTHPIGHSSSYQYPNNLHPANFQPESQTSTLYQSAPTTNWSSSGYHDHSLQPSISYSSSSLHQHAAATISSSSSQPAPKAKLPSSKKRAQAASTSHSHPSEDKAKMRSMTGRIRLPIGGSLPTEAPSPPFTVGDKRKDRTSPLPEMISATEPRTSKKARPANMAAEKALEAKRAREAERVQGYRDKQSSDIAKLTEKLPSNLRVFNKDGPSPKNVGQAIIHIDEQCARIEQLENEITRSQSEAGQLKLAQAAYTEENQQAWLQVHALSLDKHALQTRVETMRIESENKDRLLIAQSRTIRELQNGHQACQCSRTRNPGHA